MSEEKVSDHALIEAARNGDEAAFGEIMARYRNPITNYLYRFLNDYERAVDLAQETFVRVYFAIDRYHTGFAFSTYIYRIATNLAISELRRRKRRAIVFADGPFPGRGRSDHRISTDGRQALAGCRAGRGEQSRIIANAIAALPEKYRVPIILRDGRG